MRSSTLAGDRAVTDVTIEHRTLLLSARDAMLLLALLLPFVGQGFPYGFPLFLPTACVALALSLLVRAWRNGISSIKIPLDGFTFAILCVLAFYLYGMVLTIRVDVSLVGDVANVIGLLMVYTAAINGNDDFESRERLTRRFMTVLVCATTGVAAVGLVKFVLLIRGERLEFVESAASGSYPMGTSLTADYNMFALVLLSGLIVAFSRALSAERLAYRLLSCLASLLLFAGGFLSGSRRFWVMAPLAILAVLANSTWRLGAIRIWRRLFIIALVILALWILMRSYIGPFDIESTTMAARGIEARLLSLLTGAEAFESRSLRWEFAYELANVPNVWVGQGFDYMYYFSCRIGDCITVDYPHNPILSGLLYAGVAGALSVIGFLLYTLYTSCVLVVSRGPSVLMALLLLIHTPFILISSNSIISVKSYLVCAVLCSYLLLGFRAQRASSLGS